MKRIVYRGEVYNRIEAARIKALKNFASSHYMDGYHDGLKEALQILANEVTDVSPQVGGFEGRYRISNYGRVRNRDGLVKPQRKRNGYYSVGLRDGKGRKHFSLHRLVADAFVKNKNPEVFKQINHRDENKENNRADNLEWCDGMYNTHYGTAIERMRERRWGNAPTIIPAEPFNNLSKPFNEAEEGE